MGYRSNDILNKPDWSFNRSVFKSVGFSDDDLAKPIIGIANSWSELVPGHANLRQIAENVRKGIYKAGGAVAEFGVIGACDGTAQGHAGMHYILPSRDLIANDIEVMVEAHRLDGIVLLGSCDKIVPAMLMAAARLKIPAIFLPGGPMLGGIKFDGRKSDLTTMSEALGMLKSDKIDAKTYDHLEEVCGPTCGSCSFYGTANTMCCLAEALGMSLPGAALVPAVYADRLRLAEDTGKAIVSLVNNQNSSDKIITYQSLENAVRVLMATGGSTNAVLHLSAIAA
ncbi:MAG TPA: dihydroxy-acid dehydratase, partial [Negativicutes bacterium]